LAGKTPEIFFGFLSTLLPDENGQRDPAKTAAYVKANPSTWANAAWQQQVKTAASYANTEYFGLHTFYYQPDGAKQTKFRWQLVPDLGVKSLHDEQAAGKAAAFLEDTLVTQLKQKEVSFTLQAILGEPADDDVDPSVQWPPERRKVTMATVFLEAAGGDDCTVINFDPTVLSKGFSPSADPFLQMRSTAYAISFGKRLSGQ
jgi:catalase